jgi:hypothetical protein
MKYGPLAPIERAACRLEVRRCMLYLKMRFSDDSLDESVFDRLLANDELLYLHFAQIGCVGLLTERGARRIWWLPTPMSLDTYVWAYYRGFAFDQTNVLVITDVRDRDATTRVLVAGLRGSTVYREIEPLLARLPLALHLGWDPCWYLLNPLRAVDTRGGAFAFEINPRAPVEHRWPGPGPNGENDYTIRSPFAG